MVTRSAYLNVRSTVVTAAGQLFRYAVVGAVINVAGYLLYLWLTVLALDPKAAATICFAGVMAIGFVFNRTWTFQDRAYIRRTFPRYVIAYASAYIVQIVGLYLLVDLAGFRHEIVQLILIVSIACGLFAAQKIWIFSGLRGGEIGR
jgi:putative flippase GtrA